MNAIIDPDSKLNRAARVIMVVTVVVLSILVASKFLDGSLKF